MLMVSKSNGPSSSKGVLIMVGKWKLRKVELPCVACLGDLKRL